MSRGLNKLHLIGNVGADPVVRSTKSGTLVANFSVATDRWGDNPQTDWHRCTAWGQTATFVEAHVSKGDRIYVEGRVEYGTWERDGVEVPTTTVQVREVLLLSPKQGERSVPPSNPQPSAPEDADDDLPF